MSDSCREANTSSIADIPDSHRTAGSTFQRVALDLKHRAYPEVAAALRERDHWIIARWRVLSLKAMPHLDRITLKEFENSIAKILAAIADAIQSEDPQQLLGVVEQAPQHGIERFIQAFGLLDYFEEERILRGVIVIELGEAMQRAMNVGEAATFHALFDIIVQQGAMAMVQKQKAHQADAAIQESQRFVRASLDAMAGHIAVLDESGTILEVNESWRRYGGENVENPYVGAACGVGSNYVEACEAVVGRVDNDGGINEAAGCGRRIASGIRDVIAGRRGGFEAEYRCGSPAQERWFIVRAAPFQGPGPGRVVIVHEDITERKQAEAAQSVLIEQFAEHSKISGRVLSSISDFAYTFDLDGRFTFANKPLLDLWGLSLEEAVGKTFFELNYTVDLAAKLHRQIRQVIETGRQVIDETAYTSQTGVSGFYQYIFSPIIGADGAIEAVAGSTRDITAQKQVEEELRLSIVDRERLLNAERAARADAEAANQAKDRFLAVLSHELRTPLTPVVMSIAAIELNPNLPAEVRDAANMIRRNVELELTLIDDLLDISRITSGKLQLHADSIDINDLVRHVGDICQPGARGKNIRLNCDPGENGCHVVGDSARLHQVFWNLLTNAIKFTPEHGHIDVTTESIDDSRVRIIVRDTGIGIPDEVLPNIFDAFEQGDSRITRQFGGLGLGLAISKRLVEAHGGSIRAETDGPGRGSTFTVELPATPRAMPRLARASVAPRGELAAQPLSVLIVEDHADTAAVLGRLLKSAGHSVQIARTATAALILAREHSFDILVSDVGLPDMTGYELMRQIKQTCGIKGICMSGYGMEEDRRKSAEAGFAEHLVKPVNFAELERAIRRVARNSEAETAG